MKSFYISAYVAGQTCHYCPDDWVRFQGSCYLFGNGAGVHFTEAEHFCRQLKDSHLVTVESSMENGFLRDYISRLKKQDYWIGLTDVLIEGVYKWQTTDTVPTFLDWAPGQPDNGNNEDCVHFRSSDRHWNDDHCTHNYYPLCEMNMTSFVEIIG